MSNGIKDLTSRADTALDKATDYSDSLAALAVALNPATSFGQDVFDIGLGGINTLRSLFKGEGIPGREVARSGFGLLGLLPFISGAATRRGRQALADLYGPIEKGKSGGRPRAEFPEKFDKPDPYRPDVTGKIPLTKRDYEHWGYPKTKIEVPDLDPIDEWVMKGKPRIWESRGPGYPSARRVQPDEGLGPRQLNPLRAQQEKEDLVAAWLRDDKRKEIETALGWLWLPNGNEFVNLKKGKDYGARQKNIPRELWNHPEWRAIREGFVEDKNRIERAMEEGRRRGVIQSETIKEGTYFGQRQIDKAKEAEARIEEAIKKNMRKEEKAVSFMTDPDMRAGSPGSYEVELPASIRETLPGYMRKFFVRGGVGVDTRINRQLLPNQSFVERLEANPNLTPEQKIKILNDEADYILKNHGEKYHKIFTEGVPERKIFRSRTHYDSMMGSMKGRKLLPSEHDALVEAAKANPQNLTKFQQRLIRANRNKVREEVGLEPLPFDRKEKIDWEKERRIEAEQQERIFDRAWEGEPLGFMEEKPVAPRQYVKEILEGLEDLPSAGIMRVSKKGVQVIPPKVHSKVMPMNYKDGTHGLNMQPQFKGKSTMDLIKSGDRTGTSRASINKDYNVGDLVEVKGSGKEKILVRIEAHDNGSVWKKVSDIDPEEWMAREGWDLDAYNKLARAGNYQMKYSVARPHTLSTGNAPLSDQTWQRVAKKYGVSNIRVYNPQHMIGNPERRAEAGRALRKASNNIPNKYPITSGKNPDFSNALLERNYFQVKNSDGVFAVGKRTKNQEGLGIEGGSAWAVQMGIDQGKPVYVFDVVSNKWFTGDNTFIRGMDTPPTLTPNFTGIGATGRKTKWKEGFTREEKARAVKAIEDVFKKSTTPAKTGRFQNYTINNIQEGLSKMYTELGFNKPRIRQIPQGTRSYTGRVRPELLQVVREAIPFEKFLARFKALPKSEQIKYLSKYLEEGRAAEKVRKRRKVRQAIRPSPRGEATAIKRIEKRKAKEKSEKMRQEALEMERRRKLFEGKSLREQVALAMAESGNDVDKAATLLGWTNRHLKNAIKEYGLKFESKP